MMPTQPVVPTMATKRSQLWPSAVESCGARANRLRGGHAGRSCESNRRSIRDSPAKPTGATCFHGRRTLGGFRL